jgi:hypothetical protein
LLSVVDLAELPTQQEIPTIDTDEDGERRRFAIRKRSTHPIWGGDTSGLIAIVLQ